MPELLEELLEDELLELEEELLELLEDELLEDELLELLDEELLELLEEELLELLEEELLELEDSSPPHAAKLIANTHVLAKVIGLRQSAINFIWDIVTYLFI